MRRDVQEGSMRVDRSPTTLRQLALEKTRDAILRFRFRPGDRLTERELCESLGVSRSVVREVLRHLEAEGLVETIPHQGPVVTRLDREKVEEIYEIRAMLETFAASACAERADTDAIARIDDAIGAIERAFGTGDPPEILDALSTFYDELFHCGGKVVAGETFRQLTARINHLRGMIISTRKAHDEAIAELRRIRDAIAVGDADAAAAATRQHVQRSAAVARDFLDQGVTREATGEPATET